MDECEIVVEIFKFIIYPKPRMVKVSDHFIPSSGQMMSLGLFLTPTGMMCVFNVTS